MSTLQESKNVLFQSLLKLDSIEWNDQNQPWLKATAAYQRPNTPAAQQGRRVDQNGTVRYLKASDLPNVFICERRFASAYSGDVMVPTIKDPTKRIIGNKAGSAAHRAIESALPEWVETEQNSKMWVQLPSIGRFTQKETTGKKRDGITGLMDAYLPQVQTGVELKVLDGELPDELPIRALVQGAAYAYGLNNSYGTRTPERWFWVYFPKDMSTFDAHDLSTYRVFWKEWDELKNVFEEVHHRALNIAQIVDRNGFHDSYDFLSCYSGDSCLCQQ